MWYRSSFVSTIAHNSLERNTLGKKENRLEWKKYSFVEVNKHVTYKWSTSIKRIIIDSNEHKQLILLDGRNLLEAYRLLYKCIPRKIISFTTLKSKNLFTSKMKWVKRRYEKTSYSRRPIYKKNISGT